MFKQLEDLDSYNTFHTNTPPVTITRPVHRLLKASRRSLTPVRGPQRLSKAIARLATPIELRRDCQRLAHV